MPIFTPTQGQGALAPLRAPQASRPSANPLNVLAPITVFQKNRDLERQDRLLQFREKELELRESLAVLDGQMKMFDLLNDRFRVGAAQNTRAQQQNKATNFGLDPRFYPAQAEAARETFNSALNEGMGIVGNIRGTRGLNQAQTDISRLLSQTNQGLRSISGYQEALQNQDRYNRAITSVNKLVDKGKTVFPGKLQELENKMIRNGAGERTLGPSDFTSDQFVFDPVAGEKRLTDVVKNAAGQFDFAEFSKEGPDGFITIEKGKMQRSLDEAQEIAFNALAGDHDVQGIAQTWAIRNGVSEQEALADLVSREMGPFRNELDRRITGLSITKDPNADVTETTDSPFEDEELNEITEEIIAFGGDPELDKDGKAKIREIKKARKDGPVTREIIDGELVFSTGLAKDDASDVIATFPSEEVRIVGPPDPSPDQLGSTTAPPEEELEPTPPEDGSAPIPITDELLEDEGINVSFKNGVDGHSLSRKALDLIKALPSRFNVEEMVVTDTLRTQEENADANGVIDSTHLVGDGIDIRTKSEIGREFAKWALFTPEGNQWLIDNGYDAIWENRLPEDATQKERDESNEHLHLQPTAGEEEETPTPKDNPLDKFF